MGLRKLTTIGSLIALSVLSCGDRTEPPPSQQPTPLTSSSAAQQIQATRPMMVNFTRDFCVPCQIMAPWIDDLRKSHSNSVDIVDVNTDREGMDKFALFFHVQTVPYRVFIDRSGRIVSIENDIRSRDHLEESLRRLTWIP